MWNRRHVRQLSVGPVGKPDILFYFPTTVGYEHQSIPVGKDDISVVTEIIGITQPPAHRNKDIFDLLECYVYLNNPSGHGCISDASLRRLIQRLINISKRADFQIAETSPWRFTKDISSETSLRSLRFSQRWL